MRQLVLLLVLLVVEWPLLLINLLGSGISAAAFSFEGLERVDVAADGSQERGERKKGEGEPPSELLKQLWRAGFERVFLLHKGAFYEETALGIQHALQQEPGRGLPVFVSVVNEDVYWTEVMKSPKVLFVIVGGASEWLSFPPPFRYVIVQQHELGSPLWRSEHFQQKMGQALAVWEYNNGNTQLLRDAGVYAWTIDVLVEPRVLDKPYAFSNISRPTPPDRQVLDVVFLGTGTERRNVFFQELQQTGPSMGINTLYRHDESYRLLRDEVILHCKVALNIHADRPEQGLEVHRVHYLLAMGKAIVSEPSGDPEVDAMYKDAVLFSPLADMPAAIARLLHDPHERWELEQRALLLSRQIQTDDSQLLAALEGTLGLATYAKEHGMLPNRRVVGPFAETGAVPPIGGGGGDEAAAY